MASEPKFHFFIYWLTNTHFGRWERPFPSLPLSVVSFTGWRFDSTDLPPFLKHCFPSFVDHLKQADGCFLPFFLIAAMDVWGKVLNEMQVRSCPHSNKRGFVGLPAWAASQPWGLWSPSAKGSVTFSFSLPYQRDALSVRKTAGRPATTKSLSSSVSVFFPSDSQLLWFQ